MAPRRFVVLGLLFSCSFTLHVVALDDPRLLDSAECKGDWCASQKSLHRRQTPVIIAPPTIPRTSAYIPPIPRPTTSLNYWWPYGSNGVNPTSTPSPTPPAVSMLVSSTAEVDSDTIPTEGSITSSMTSQTSSSDEGSSTTKTTTSTSSTSESPSATETPEPDLPEHQIFQVVTLLPLFIIMGVLALATVVGWTYGRCLRWCRRHKEPEPGSRDIGGRPYEFSGFGSDTVGPMRSSGVGWVDASRMNAQNTSAPPNYHVVGTGQWTEEPGTPSKNKPRTAGLGGWFRHTLSKNKGLPAHSPSGEKGLGPPFALGMQDSRVHGSRGSARYLGTVFQTRSSPSLEPESPKRLRVVNTSPNTLSIDGVRSPATSSQPTPRLAASRHGSIRRKIVERVQAEDEEGLLTATGLSGAFRGFDDKDGCESKYGDDWANLGNDPLKESPARRYFSGNASPTSPRSPDPQEHRARMRRLRAAAESTALVSDIAATPPRATGPSHPLPPAPAVLLSPLQLDLFFTGHDSSPPRAALSPDSATSPFARSDPSRNLNERSNGSQPTKDDPFGPCAPASPTKGGRIRRAQRVNYSSRRARESTETSPLSPELRGAAMTRFEQIVKTNWSMRNLAGVPLSPTLYGALSPSETQRAQFGDEEDRVGIEDVLLAGRSSGRI